MKSRIFLIILGFIQSVYCLQISNITNDESYPVCPVSLFRRKRANMEYTRWRFNEIRPTEFIVKVLEDEIATIKPIVAVNILPDMKRGEKIIVGGAMVPPPTATPSDLQFKDYTRFMPPTTPNKAQVDKELYLAPAHYPNIEHQPITPKARKEEPAYPPIYAVAKHAQRDESPPASPQFLARMQTPIIRQYAPISPVFFNRRNSLTPLTPPAYHISRTETMPPTQSSPLSGISSPTRTVPHDLDFSIFQPFVEEEVDTKEIFATRSTIRATPSRSSPLPDLTTEEILAEEDIRTTQKNFRDVPNEIDSAGDFSYHNMFYQDEYKDSDLRKKGDESVENDEETTKQAEKSYSNEVVGTTSNSTPETITEEKSVDQNYFDDDDDQTEQSTKKTPKMTFTGVLDKDDLKVAAYNRVVKERLGRENPQKKTCNVCILRQLNFNSPRTLQEIVVQLKAWAEESPLVKSVDITNGNYTAMENPIYLMIVDDPSTGQIITAKQTVMIVAGIQGRDHHAVAAAMYLLYQLIERSGSHADLLSKYRFWIIPVFNPDGYDYSMTFPHRREWTKNLRQSWESCRVKESCGYCEAYGLRCTIQPCYGVNLDRNFEYQWIPTEELRAEHPCGTLYAGERQLSEVETRALTQYLHGVHNQAPIYCFIAFKEGDVLGIMYPYSHTKKKRAYEYIYKQRASRAASAAYSISGRQYVSGQTSEYLPLYAGGIEDWVEGHLGIDNTYTIMLFRPTDSYNTKLITERVVHEAYAAVDTLLLHHSVPQEVRLVASFQWKTLPSLTLTLFNGLLSTYLNLIAF